MRRFSSVCAAFAAKLDARRQCRPKPLLPLLQRWLGRDRQQNAIDAAHPVQRPLRGCDVHEDQTAGVTGILEKPENLVFAGAIVDLQANGVAIFHSQTVAHPNAVLVRQVLRVLAQNGANVGRLKVLRMLSNQIEPNQGNSLSGRRHDGVALDSGVNRHRIRQGHKGSDDFIRHSTNGSDFEIGIANQGFDGGVKGTRGGISSQLDCQHDCNAKCDRKHDQRCPQRVAVEGTDD